MMHRPVNAWLIFQPLLVLASVVAATTHAEIAPPDFQLAVPGLKSVVIDREEKESFLSLQLDSAGRLFAGCREALFVYEPAPGGLYQKRQLLFGFPKDAWVYDIAVRGDDLYVATHTAIYLLKNGVKQREGLAPQRLVWGLPMMAGWGTHQGIHALAFGPEGDLYFSNGDEIVGYGDFKRPDHWLHWTYAHGTQRTEVTGTGGVFRISPDGEEFTVVADGLRNPCGMAFDRQWNLFANDNDHESMPAQYVPGRLVHITPGAFFSWPRGWMPEKQAGRLDLLDTLHPDVGRYVPVGQAYYDDDYLPEPCRHALYVAEWGRGKVLRYPLRAEGASFKAEQQDFLSGPPNARPVSVATGRGGRLFVAVCHMKGNEASPVYQSEIVMITRADDTPAAPFDGYDATTAPVEKLAAELAQPSWSRRARAHLELVRRGPAACAEALHALPPTPENQARLEHSAWLLGVAQQIEPLKALCHSKNDGVRLQAIRSLAASSLPGREELLQAALADPGPSVAVAAWFGVKITSLDALAAAVKFGGSDNRLLRQSAVQGLAAAHMPPSELADLCSSKDAPERRLAILVLGQQLTVPPSTGALPADWPLDPMPCTIEYVGETVRLGEPGDRRNPVGRFTMADVWAKAAHSAEAEQRFALLQQRLDDPAPELARQAAYFLSLLRDPRTDARCQEILGLKTAPGPLAAPLKGAVAGTATEMPPAFRGLNWAREAAAGDAKKGAEIFTTHGCTVCHAAKAGDVGGGAPALAGAGTRFDATYLAESVMMPNKVVSPEFRWTMVTKKDGGAIAGLVTSENGAELELLLPAGVRQTVKKAEIAQREFQDRSPMPEGLIQTPAELRDLVAFLLSLKEAK